MRKLLFLLLALSASSLQAATITYGAASGNWSDATKWVGAATPTASDDVVINGTSGAAVTIDTSTCVAKSLTCTGYTGNIRFNASQTLTVSGNVLFAATHTLTSTGTLAVNATATITSAGLTFPGSLTLIGTSTITLGDNWIVAGTLSQTTNVVTLNSNAISVGGSLSAAAFGLVGTTVITLNGSGTISSSSNTNSFGIPIVINTAGSVTLGASLAVTNGCSFTYTAGTVVNTNSVLFPRGGAVTFNTSGMNWARINMNAATVTITLASNFNSNSSYMRVGSFLTATFVGNFDVTIPSLICEVGTVLKLAAGRTLNVSSSIYASGNPDQPCAIQSATPSSSTFLSYSGPLSGLNMIYTTLTDIDATGSPTQVWAYNANTLTRTTNIQNVTLPTTMGYVWQ